MLGDVIRFPDGVKIAEDDKEDSSLTKVVFYTDRTTIFHIAINGGQLPQKSVEFKDIDLYKRHVQAGVYVFLLEEFLKRGIELDPRVSEILEEELARLDPET